LEVLKPPYQVVQQQEATARGKLKVVGAKMSDSHTLVLTTDPHPQKATYAISSPGVKAPKAAGAGATVDLDYEVGGDLSRAQWELLVGELPYGREIAAAQQRNFLEIAGVHRVYPYIHPQESLQSAPAVELVGGDFERGRSLFFGEQLKCATCHRLRGEGATIGPDLSNLAARSPAAVLRDIRQPSASIHPDYVAYNVALKNGESLTGFVRSQDEHSLRMTAADGKEQIFARGDIEQLRPSNISLMPEGLEVAMTPREFLKLTITVKWPGRV
jgi:putative heme-binding domain-containing protein